MPVPANAKETCREGLESTGCQVGAQREFGSRLGLLPRGRHPQWWLEPAGGAPSENEATGQALVTALKRNKGAKFNGIITPDRQSLGIPFLKNMCSILVVTPKWHQRTEFCG